MGRFVSERQRKKVMATLNSGSGSSKRMQHGSISSGSGRKSRFLQGDENYPEELTFDQFDKISWDYDQQFGLDDDKDMTPAEIEEFANKIGGKVYTQVDGENDRVYVKGLHKINRTGIYEVVRREPYNGLTKNRIEKELDEMGKIISNGGYTALEFAKVHNKVIRQYDVITGLIGTNKKYDNVIYYLDSLLEDFNSKFSGDGYTWSTDSAYDNAGQDLHMAMRTLESMPVSSH